MRILRILSEKIFHRIPPAGYFWYNIQLLSFFSFHFPLFFSSLHCLGLFFSCLFVLKRLVSFLLFLFLISISSPFCSHSLLFFLSFFSLSSLISVHFFFSFLASILAHSSHFQLKRSRYRQLKLRDALDVKRVNGIFSVTGVCLLDNCILQKNYKEAILQEINPFQPNVALYIKTSHLSCKANQMTGFCKKSNTVLKGVNSYSSEMFSEVLYIRKLW